MHDGPGGAILLEIARRTLLDDILPHAAHEQRYTLRMIAHAMAIGGRELAMYAPGIEGAVACELRHVYRAAKMPAPAEDLSPAETERRFARDLRSGRFDDHPEIVVPFLERRVRERIALADPKRLAANAQDQPEGARGRDVPRG